LQPALESSLSKLQENSKAWADISDLDRAAVARACRLQFATAEFDFEKENLKCLGLDASRGDYYNTLGFDPFLLITTTADRLDKIADFLEGKLKDLQTPKRQLPEAAGGLSVFEMGQVGQAAPGCSLEIWAGSDSSAGEKKSPSGVSLVLGAGNQNFLTTVDIIERAFVHKECVFLKHHPIRPFMKPFFDHIFAPLAEKGAFASCLDSDLAGAYEALICHKTLTHIHMTGSGKTHDAIVASLKKAGRHDKVEFTSELGCVSPWIICPGTKNNGTWTDVEIQHHATMLTSAFKASCSMNCLSPKVLVLPSQEVWPQRTAFLEALKARMAVAPDMPPYYPGAAQRYANFQKQYPDAVQIQAPMAQDGAPLDAPYPGQDFKQLPSMLVETGVLGSAESKTYALVNEAFAPVLAIATAACETRQDFPLAAAKAVNTHLFGNLSCNIIYPDDRDEALDKVVNELSYGCVAVNMWAALSYSNPLAVWGAAPGQYTADKPESGLDFVGNAARIPDVRKNVVVSPFVNSSVALDKVLPMIVLESLQVVMSGKRFVLPRIIGILFSRAFGLLS